MSCAPKRGVGGSNPLVDGLKERNGVSWRLAGSLIRELIAAACSDELFTLIDLNYSMFMLLQEEEALTMIDTEWKRTRQL